MTGVPLIIAFVVAIVVMMIYLSVLINFSYAVFNFIPVPPLDGSRIFYVFLPPRLYYKVMQHERTITLVVMALLLLGPLSSLINLISSFIVKGMFFAVGMQGFLI